MTSAPFFSDRKIVFTNLGESEEKLSDSVEYMGRVELPKGYDSEYKPTPIQRQIELSVTNGRGYESFGQALAVANNRLSSVGLNISLDSALEHMPVVSYEDEVQAAYSHIQNHCGEVGFLSLAPSPFSLPDVREKLTLTQRIMHNTITADATRRLREERKKQLYPSAMVDIFPDYSIVFN